MNTRNSTWSHERIPYQPIVGQRAFRLPNNARVAVWTIVNVEHWLPNAPMPRAVLPPPTASSPSGSSPLLPDVPNWCWHEYGMRVGFWRLLDALRSRGLRATLAVNGSAVDCYREACGAALEAGWEFMGHGFVQQPSHRVEDESGAIRRTVEAISRFTGKPPRGWESPGLTETYDTLDLLADAGIEYVADWVLDDQPVSIATRRGPIVSVPYTIELNDVVLFAIQQQTAMELLQRGRDQFDRLWQEGARIPRVMAISVHPYLTGAPHRIRYLEALYDHILQHPNVISCTGEEILDFYRVGAPEAQQPRR